MITVFVGLYTSRLVLEILGVDNYGIFNVVGGVIALMGFIGGTLATSTQRFLNYEMGNKENSCLQQIFSASFAIHLTLSLIILFHAETIGLIVLNKFVNIDPSRMGAANVLYQISILIFMINMITSPYNALIIAHERMDVFAYVSIFECFLKLGLVILISKLSGDSLLWWGVALLLLSLSSQSIYLFFSRKNYVESKLMIVKDWKLYKNMVSYVGWNLVGIISATLSTQGINLLLNVFFGVRVNAARGIAVQVENQVTSFVNNFQTAINPQIVKSCSAKNYKYMNSLIQYGTKYSFYLLLIIAAPILIETDEILSLWLKEVPEYTVIFTRLTMIFLLVQIISNTLITSITATGKIRKYEIIISFMLFLNFLFSLILFYFGASPVTPYVIIIINGSICFYIRLHILSGLIPIDKVNILKNILLRCGTVCIFSMGISYMFKSILEESFCDLIAVIIFTLSSTILTVWFWGLSKDEKEMTINYFKQKVQHVKH